MVDAVIKSEQKNQMSTQFISDQQNEIDNLIESNRKIEEQIQKMQQSDIDFNQNVEKNVKQLQEQIQSLQQPVFKIENGLNAS